MKALCVSGTRPAEGASEVLLPDMVTSHFASLSIPKLLPKTSENLDQVSKSSGRHMLAKPPEATSRFSLALLLRGPTPRDPLAPVSTSIWPLNLLPADRGRTQLALISPWFVCTATSFAATPVAILVRLVGCIVVLKTARKCCVITSPLETKRYVSIGPWGNA